MKQPIPMLIHSESVEPVRPDGAGMPLKDAGTIYSMAQEVRWLDEDHFAIGRWDGSLTIFKHEPAPLFTPIICAALVAPSLAGVEMISRLMPNLFASSNGS